MKNTSLLRPATALVTLIALSLPASAAAPSNEELMKKIEELNKTVTDLKAKVQASAAAGKPAATDKKTAGKAAAVKVIPQQEDYSIPVLKGVPLLLKDVATAFDVPDSPAASVVHMPQEKVQHLRTPKEFGAAALSGLDSKGDFKSGFAVDFAPAQLIWRNQPIGDFRYSGKGKPMENVGIWWKRVLVRTQLSIAGIKGTKDGDKSAKIALGIHSVLANSDDPLSGANGHRWQDGRIVSDDTFMRDPNVEVPPYVVLGEDGYPLDDPGRKLNHWHHTSKGTKEDPHAFQGEGPFADAVNFLYDYVSYGVGAAPLWLSPLGDSTYEYGGTTMWSSLGIAPLPSWPVQFNFDVEYRNAEVLGTSSAIGGAAGLKAAYGLTAPKSIKQDQLQLTASIKVGTRDFNGSFSATYLDMDQGILGNDSAIRYSITLEKRVSQNTWLTLSASQDNGHKDGKNDSTVLGGLKIGLGPRDFSTDGQKANTAAKR